MRKFKHDAVIVGGLGHVGLPLGIVFADKGLGVCLFDLDSRKARAVRKGHMPFIEYGADEILPRVIKNGNLRISTDPICVSDAEFVIVAIGTPMDEYLNPKMRQFLDFFKTLAVNLAKEQTIIIRSTVFPQTCRQIQEMLGSKWKIAYCPERIVQGHAVEELAKLPQIVSGYNGQAVNDAERLFRIISPKVIRTTVEEAEMVKLFSNAWRYIQFAAANQFYMLCSSHGVDFDRVRKTMVESYERSASLPKPGFAAGPCLLKDTMQLCSFSGNSFHLGQSAMLVNEGMPNFIVESLKQKHGELKGRRIGILGMAFKADIDDIRDSLSYKLGKILRFYGADVSYSDEFAQDPTFVKKEVILKRCDIIILGVPHSAYRNLKVRTGAELVDIWGFLS
ncbi:MAG: nucleotide sugar dehydrogenase [Victivallales bacterium]